MTSNDRAFNPTVEYYPPTIQAKYGIEPFDDGDELFSLEDPSADIGWAPDLEKFQKRTAERLKDMGQSKWISQLPNGWPRALDHPLAWKGTELQPDDYVHELGVNDVGEIEAALSGFKGTYLGASFFLFFFFFCHGFAIRRSESSDKNSTGLDLDLQDVRKSTFPLPNLGPRLERLSGTIYNGRGVCVVRGLDPKAYSREDNVIIYLGVSSYFGEHRGRQQQDGRMMCQ